MASLAPVPDAQVATASAPSKFSILEAELALSDQTGQDLHQMLTWEKAAHQQAKQRHALLQQEHLQLQQKHLQLQQKHRSYVFQIAFAKDSQQNIQELQAEVNDLQEELSILQGDHNRYWVEKRQLVVTNSNLTQEMERVVTESQFVSLQLKTAYDDNGYLRQALKEANKELSAKAEEVQLLKAQLAAMSEARARADAMESPLRSPFGSPISAINTATRTPSGIKAKQASFAVAALKRTPLGTISNARGNGRLQGNRASFNTRAAVSPLVSTSPRRQPQSALLKENAPRLTPPGCGPCSTPTLHCEALHVPVFSPLLGFSLPASTSAARLVSSPPGSTQSIRPTGYGIHSRVSLENFRPGSSCHREGENDAALTFKPKNITTAQGSGKLEGKGTGFIPEAVLSPLATGRPQSALSAKDLLQDTPPARTSFPTLHVEAMRALVPPLLLHFPLPTSTSAARLTPKPGSSSNGEDSVPSFEPRSVRTSKAASSRSSSGEESPPWPAVWHMTVATVPVSPSAAVLATPAPAKNRKTRGITRSRVLRWHYRSADSSCSSLTSWDSDCSPSPGLQSAQLPTIKSAKRKPLSRQEVLEQHYRYGHSSCSDNDSDDDVSAVSARTSRLGAGPSPAATASLSTPRLFTASESDSPLLATAGSYGELNFAGLALFRDPDSPLSDATVSLRSPLQGKAASPSTVTGVTLPSPLLSIAPEPACRNSSATRAEGGPPSTPPDCSPNLSTGSATARATARGVAVPHSPAVSVGLVPSRASLSLNSPAPTTAAAAQLHNPSQPTAVSYSKWDFADVVLSDSDSPLNSHSLVPGAAGWSDSVLAGPPSCSDSPGNSSSSKCLSRGSMCSSATTSRAAWSGSQGRRPAWSIAGPLSPVVSMTPVELAPTLARAAPVTRSAASHTAKRAGLQSSSTGCAAVATAGMTAVIGGLTPSSVNATRPARASNTAAAPSSTATARPTCRATALPTIAEVRGSAVQHDRPSAPRPLLYTSSAAGEPVQRKRLSRQSSTLSRPAARQEAPPCTASSSSSTVNRTAANRGLHSTMVPPAVAGVITRGQAAAAAAASRQAETKSATVVVPSTRTRQARSLKPEAPTRQQPQRAVKPQWR